MSEKWEPWQVIVLVMAIIASLAFVAWRVIEARPSQAVVTISQTPSPTKPWPTRPPTRTPTPTIPPTPTPGPTSTPTRTPTPTLTPTLTPTATPTPRVVIHEIRALGRLETTEFVMETVVAKANEPRNLWERIFGPDKILLVAAGEVVAGFDLTRIEKNDVTVRGDSVVLTLPQPEIFYSRVDNARTYVYSREKGFLVASDIHLETEARRLAEQRLLDWALKNGILDKAKASGRVIMENFLRALGFTNITIRYRLN